MKLGENISTHIKKVSGLTAVYQRINADSIVLERRRILRFDYAAGFGTLQFIDYAAAIVHRHYLWINYIL